MFEKLRHVFLPRSFFTGSQLERRRSLLMYMLLMVGACSLPFYFIPHPDYNHIANLVGTAGYWGLLAALLIGVPYLFVVHGILVWSIGYVAYLAAMTGGINSPVMVWMTVVSLTTAHLSWPSLFFWPFLGPVTWPCSLQQARAEYVRAWPPP